MKPKLKFKIIGVFFTLLISLFLALEVKAACIWADNCGGEYVGEVIGGGTCPAPGAKPKTTSKCCCDLNNVTIPTSANPTLCRWEMEYNGNPCGMFATSSATVTADNSCASTNKPDPKAKCCCRAENPLVATKPAAVLKNPFDNLSIPIPGLYQSLNCTKNADGSYTCPKVNCEKNSEGIPVCEVPWIGQYIVAIYNYALIIIGALAAVTVMAGGIMWLISGSSASRMKVAKEMIIGSVSGLIIMFSSYMIISIVNPDLLFFKPLSIGYIEKVVLEGDNDSPNVSLNVTGIASAIGANCGKDTVAQIVNKAKGKITYDQILRNKTATNGFVYLDCSSFASFVLKCATGKNSTQYSATVFGNQQIWNQKLESLEPGDVVGWAPKNNSNNSGHVIIYMGDGKFGDCHGSGKKGLITNCVSNSMSFDFVKKYAKSHSDGNLYMRHY